MFKGIFISLNIKKSLILAILAVLCCFSVVFADDPVSDDPISYNSDISYQEQTLDLYEIKDTLKEIAGTLQETKNNGVLELEPASTEVTQLRVSASDTSGLHAIILGMIGDYNPIAVTTKYQYPYGSGYQDRYQVDVEPDWSWIMTAVLFIIVVYCFLRIIGGIFKGGK